MKDCKFKKGDVLKYCGEGVKAVWILTDDPIKKDNEWWLTHPTYGLVWASSCDYASAADAREEMLQIYAQYNHAAREVARIKSIVRKFIPDSMVNRFSEKKGLIKSHRYS